jgi:GT2 family glycosyltransferase
MPPGISIIIATYNRSKELTTCLKALEQQVSNADDIEIIIVDNNSTEDIAAVTAQLSFPVRLTKQSVMGAAAARNLGAHQAVNTTLVFMDSDTLVAPDWLLQARAELGSLENLDDLFAGAVVQITPSSNRFVSLLDGQSLNQESLITSSGFAASAHLWISRSLYIKAGGFDESKAVCEDYFFCKAVLAKGGTLRYWQDVIVYHPAQETLKDYIHRLKRNCYAEVITRRASGQSNSSIFFRSLVAHTLIEPIAITAKSNLRFAERLAHALTRIVRPIFISIALLNKNVINEQQMKGSML